MARILVTSDDGEHRVEVVNLAGPFDEAQYGLYCDTHSRLDYTERSRRIEDAVAFAEIHVDGGA